MGTRMLHRFAASISAVATNKNKGLFLGFLSAGKCLMAGLGLWDIYEDICKDFVHPHSSTRVCAEL